MGPPQIYQLPPELDLYVGENTNEELDYNINQIDLVGDISNTVRVEDKVLFTFFSMDAILTPFLAGLFPHYFFIWHTMKACFLLPFRLWFYKKENMHYFLFDFCYFVNLLLLFYLWLIPPGLFAGNVFAILFCYANGPLLWGIPMWRNSLVFHSVDKMTSFYLHISPAMAVSSLRWHSIDGYTICPKELTENTCSLSLTEFLLYPIIGFVLWQAIYFLWVDLIRKKHVQRNKIYTSYTWMIEHVTKGFSYRIVHLFGPQWCKPMYMLVQISYYILFMAPSYLLYYSAEVNILALIAFMAIACWNGAQYYIDVFSERYHRHVEKLR